MNSSKKANKSIWVFGSLYAFFVFGCSSTNLYAEVSVTEGVNYGVKPMQLENSNGWKLERLVNAKGESVTISPDTKITLFFQDQRISGFAGCNRYSCSYKINEDQLELSPIITTRKYCNTPENVMQTEMGFITALGNVVRYSLKNEALTLFNADDKPVVIFKNSE